MTAIIWVLELKFFNHQSFATVHDSVW